MTSSVTCQSIVIFNRRNCKHRGIAAAILAGFPLLRTGWILWPSVLFAISGAAFEMRVAPLQRQLAAFAHAAQGTEQSWKEYEALYRKWELWGLLAIATPTTALMIMILKPSIPAL